MQSLRLVAAMLALVLVASACGDDDNGEEVGGEPTSTTVQTTPTTSGPVLTQPTTTTTTTTTTAPSEDDGTVEPGPAISDGEEATPLTTPSAEPPTAPSNVRCAAGSGDGELLVEWNAISNPSDISKIRVYVSEDGGPFVTNGEFTMGQVDTNRSGGSRWAAPARGLPADVPLRLTATSFNQLGQESGWNITPGTYTGPGEPCDGADPVPTPTTAPVLPPTICTAGCDEEEGEPAA